MKVKNYRAPTLAEAIAEAKNDLGRDAVIIQTRRLRQGGFLGMLATEVVEVTAAIDQTVSKQQPPPREREKPSRSPEVDDSKILALQLELASMRKSLDSVLNAKNQDTAVRQPLPEAAPKKSPLLEWARQNDIEPRAADALLHGLTTAAIGNQAGVQAQLKERLYSYFQRSEGIVLRSGYCKVVALVGPTGVGKTTTVAKLAANFALREKYRVALVTADTYRIAAVEQLKTYADLIGIPIDVVYTREELRAALFRHQDKQLVLIDTAGRAPSDQPQMAELESLMSVDDSIEKHLVLSATTKFTETLDAVRRFRDTNPQKYLFTKIDEACNLGTVFSLLYHAPKPLSYITTGQNVPDDIEPANPERLTTLMMRGKL